MASVSIGLLLIEAICLTAWIAEPRSAAPLSDALRTGGAFWLLGHGGRLGLPAGTAALIPLGLSVLFAALAARSGAAVARVRPAGPRRRVLLACAIAVAIPYALLAALVAAACRGGGLHSSIPTASVGALILSAAAAWCGAARELPLAVPSRSRTQAVASGVGAAGALLLGVAALLAGIALLSHLSDAAALARPAKAGAVGGFGLLMLQAALTPNAVIWSASYLLGPGFAVGAGSLVSPTSVHLGELPGLPMLAGLPSSALPWPLYILFLVPPAAGVLGGMVTVRRLPRTPKLPAAALLGAAIAVTIGVLAALFAALSGGSVTKGRLATIGPSPWSVGAMAALEIGIPAIAAAFGLTWHRQRTRGRMVAPPPPLAKRVRGLGPAVVASCAAGARGTGAWFRRLGGRLIYPFGFRARKRAAAVLDLEETTDLTEALADLREPEVVAPEFVAPGVVAPEAGAPDLETTDLTEALAQLREPAPVESQPVESQPVEPAPKVSLVKVDKPSAESTRKRRWIPLPRRPKRKPKVIKLPD